MNYSEFLFVQLLMANSKYFAELEYDILYQFGTQYKYFEESKYNVDEQSEYGCIQAFINNFTEFKLSHLMAQIPSEGDIYTITKMDAGNITLSDVKNDSVFTVSNLDALRYNLFN